MLWPGLGEHGLRERREEAINGSILGYLGRRYTGQFYLRRVRAWKVRIEMSNLSWREAWHLDSVGLLIETSVGKLLKSAFLEYAPISFCKENPAYREHASGVAVAKVNNLLESQSLLRGQEPITCRQNIFDLGHNHLS